MDWESCRYFLALARKGTLKQAAKELKVNQTTVGRRLESLEEQLRVKLFDKRSDGFLLTVAGERMLEVAEDIENRFLAIERQIMGRDQRLHGVLKLALPGAFANHAMIPILRNWIERFPQIELQLITGPEIVNLSRREADLAIRLVRPKQSELIVRKFGSLELGFYCHSNKLKAFRALKAGGEEVPFVDLYSSAMSLAQSELMMREKTQWRTVIRTSAWSSVFEAVSTELGVGVLPRFLAQKQSTLVTWSELKERIPMWLVVHPDVAKSSRVRVFIDYLEQNLLA